MDPAFPTARASALIRTALSKPNAGCFRVASGLGIAAAARRVAVVKVLSAAHAFGRCRERGQTKELQEEERLHAHKNIAGELGGAACVDGGQLKPSYSWDPLYRVRPCVILFFHVPSRYSCSGVHGPAARTRYALVVAVARLVPSRYCTRSGRSRRAYYRVVSRCRACYGSRPTDGELDRVTDRHSRSLPATHIANDEIRGQVESVGGRACGASKFYRPRRRVRVRCGCILCRKPTQARPQARPSTTGHDLLSYKRFVTTTTHSYM